MWPTLEELLEKIVTRANPSRAVLEAMRKVPRTSFLAADWQSMAYKDTSLPIGEGQTISQPSLVAMMTDELELSENAKVLEIGTGCGYQTALLCELAAEVYTIEVREGLAAGARERLKQLGYHNVEFRTGDGTLGWPEAAPFDAIIVAAHGPAVPGALLEQLKVGGRLIIPIGTDDDQQLMRIAKTATGSAQKALLPVRFVPIVNKP